MRNEYVNIKYVTNKLSNCRLSTVLNRIVKEDKTKIQKRVRVFSDGAKNKKNYFIHHSCIDLIQLKRKKKIIDKSELFVTIMVKNQNCFESFFIDFINELKTHKPHINIGFVTEGSPINAHLHFIVKMSEKELLKTLKKIVNTQYFQVLKFIDLDLKKIQTNYYTANTNSPIYITNISDINGLTSDYMIKQNKMKYI